MTPTRILIYGSCVSRDLFEFLPDSTLTGYLARQSIISLGNRVQLREPPVFDSAFQQRLSDLDISGAGCEWIAERAKETDLLVMDLMDERHGVYVCPGGYMTRTTERIGIGCDRAFSDVITFGSNEHRYLWELAWSRFIDFLECHSLRTKTIMLAIPWATQTATGQATPTSYGLSATKANTLFRYYYGQVAMSRIPLIKAPRNSVFASETHRWGFAPFHYENSVYAKASRRLQRFSMSIAKTRHFAEGIPNLTEPSSH